MRVCILGSGLSALTLANAMVNENIHVDIVLSQKKHIISKSRTLGISKSNFEFFNKNIINIEKIIWKLKKIEIFTENLSGEKILNFESSSDQLFSIIKNINLYDVLYKNLKSKKNQKKIKFSTKLSNISDYNLVINTDYSNSLTQKYFNKRIFKTYNSYAYSTVINHEEIKNDVAMQIFTKRGPLAFLPISKNYTSIVYSIYNSNNKIKESITDLINYYNTKYKIKKIEDCENFELKSLILRSYYNNNILAFGDLLHKIHPLAGQGFNMTIRDVKILIEIIKEKHNLGLPIDNTVNKQFEKKVKHKNYIFSNGIDLIHEFFNFERKFKNSFLSQSVQFIGKNQSVNKFFTKIADEGFIF